MAKPLLSLADLRVRLLEEGEKRGAQLIPHVLPGGKLPTQTHYVGSKVRVRFQDDYHDHFGVIVRDDLVGSETMIIRMDDGRFVLQIECEELEPWGTP